MHREVKPWPPASWDFMLLTLAAFYYSPDLDLARAKWQEAQAGEITAGEYPNPTLDYTINQEAMLGITIETAGKRGYRRDRARHLSDAAGLNIEAIAWQARSRLRSRLLAVYAGLERKPICFEQMKGYDEIVSLLERRLKAGEASQVEVASARIARDKTRLSCDELHTQIIEAKARLAAAIGLPVSALEGIDISFELFRSFPRDLALNQLKEKALLNRPDILAALAEYEAAQSALQLEIAKQYPDINIGPDYVWDQGAYEWTIGISITLPVFNRNQGEIAEAEARRGEAANRFIILQSSVIADLDRSLAGYQGSLRKLTTAEALVESLDKQVKSAEAMFAAGETDQLDLIRTQMELLMAKISRLDAAVKAQEALGDLEDAAQYSLNPEREPPGEIYQNQRQKGETGK